MKIPSVMLRDVAFLPDETKVNKKIQNESIIVNLSEKIRRSVGKIRRFSYLNPSLIDDKYSEDPSSYCEDRVTIS